MKEKSSAVEKRKIRNSIIEWIFSMLGYALVFILASLMFDSFYIDLSHFGIYALLLSVIIYLLNKTVKPLLLFLTMPITGLTLGLFYFVINLFILKLGDWILMGHFNMGTHIYTFFIAVFISIMNLLVENIIIKPVIRRIERNE